MALPEPISFGNLTITPKKSVVELTLITQVSGRSHAIFTYGEIPTLIALLKKHTVAPVEDEEDWSALI